jgi:ubiquinone/menaquinone biosynthesis C-methylase UbiE
MSTDAQFWNSIAEKYSKQPVADPGSFDRKIALTQAKMRPSDVVLDVGCGTGSLALRLAGSAAVVHGLDLSAEMIRIAGEKADRQGASNVKFHVGDLETLTFEDESLDGICAYSLLHLVRDRQATLQRIFQLLKPGGFFISSNVCLGDTWVPYGVILPVMRWIGKAPFVDVYSRERLEGDVRRAGFVDLSFPDVGAKETVAFLVAMKPGA